MSVPFELPEWLMPAAPPPPDTSTVDPHRIEGLVNRFIAAKQDALFTGPDAYYRSEGRDAVMLLPFIKDRLTGLKDEQFAEALPDYPQTRAGVAPESLIQPLTEGERAVLGERLDAHIAEAMDGINRHAAKQRDALNRQTLAERQALILRAAELEHTNDDKLDGLAEANAGAAFELARMNGQPEGPAAEAARSSIWQTAINQRLANGDGAGALILFDRVRHQLSPADRRSLDTLLQAIRHDWAADEWIARQTATDGPPVLDRIAGDPELPPGARVIVRAKLDARNSIEESKRAAAAKGLDDQLADTTLTLAATPGTYKIGTLARIADAYEASGESDKAASARRLAVQESALASFAQASADRQQRMIDELPEGALRDTALALKRHQAEAFARDAFAAGTALYPEVGPPVPIDDIKGRIRQAREIAGRSGIPVAPFTADEITGIRRALADGSPEDRHALLTQITAMPDDMKAVLAPLLMPPKARETAGDIPANDPARHRDGAPIAQAEPDQPQPANTDREAGTSYEIDAQRSMEALRKLQEEEAARAAEGFGGQGMAPPTEPAPGTPEYQAADAEARRIVAEQEQQRRRPKETNVPSAAEGGQVTPIATEPAPGNANAARGVPSQPENGAVDGIAAPSASGQADSPATEPMVTAQVVPPTTMFGRVPPTVGRPAPPPGSIPTPEGLTPLEQLPRGSSGGDKAGKAFPRKDNPYPEGIPCIYCGQPTTKRPGLPDTLERDHIIPRSRDGNGDPTNRVPSCRSCNREKGPRTPSEWYLWRWEEASAMPDNFTKIRFHLDPEDWHGETAELLWAEPIGPKGSRVFRLMNSPYYARGVSYLDIVRAEEAPDGLGLDYAGTVESSGHSTLWLLAPPNSAEFARHWENLHSKGCRYESENMNTEGGKRTLYSVDVPPEANFDEIVDILDDGDRRGVWIWQIPHAGHGSPRSPTPSGNA